MKKKLLIIAGVLLIVGLASSCTKSKSTCDCTITMKDNGGYINSTTHSTVEVDGKCSDGNTTTTSNYSGVQVTITTVCE